MAEQQQSSAGIRDQKVSFSSQQSTQRVYILKISSLLKSNQMHSVQNYPKMFFFKGATKSFYLNFSDSFKNNFKSKIFDFEMYFKKH